MDEEQLIHAAQKGDLDAFNRLVLNYQGLAFNVAYRLLGDDPAAEDVTQEAFISAYKHLRSYRGGSFKAWLLRIVTNVSYDELRRRQRRPQISLEPEGKNGEDVPEPAWLADPGESPQDLTERVELNRAIQRCLAKLESEFEAAQILRKPLGTVKSRLARARSRLQLCLQGFMELLPDRFRLNTEGSSE